MNPTRHLSLVPPPPEPVVETGPDHLANRSATVYLLTEDLARAHMAEHRDEADRHRQARRMARAQRLQRRADRAAARARRANHLTVVH